MPYPFRCIPRGTIIFGSLVAPKAGWICPLLLSLGKCFVGTMYKRTMSYNWSQVIVQPVLWFGTKKCSCCSSPPMLCYSKWMLGHGRNTQISEQLSVALAKGPSVNQSMERRGTVALLSWRLIFLFGLGLVFGLFSHVLTLQPGFALRCFVFSWAVGLRTSTSLL